MNKNKVIVTLACILTTGVFGGFAFRETKSGDSVKAAAPDTSIVYEESSSGIADTSSAAETIAAVSSSYITDDTSSAVKAVTTVKTSDSSANSKETAKTTKKAADADDSSQPAQTRQPEQAVTGVPTSYQEIAAYYEPAYQQPAEPVTQAQTEAVTTTAAPAETTAPTETTVPEKTDKTELAAEAEETPEETAAEEAQPEEEVTETPAEEEIQPEEESENPNAITVTDEEYYMLCNMVGHEYGSDWISEYDKALVVEVIMNRVNSPLYPNTIYDVLMQPYQFSGCYYIIHLGGFSNQVTESVKAAVDLYLSDPGQFNHGYTSFYGDGYRNYFS